LTELSLTPLEAAGHLLGRYSAFAIDLDGVVWRGEVFVDGAIEGLRAIRATGKPLVLMTNNGSYLPEVIVERLHEGGFAVEPSEVLTSSLVARRWISEQGLTGGTAFVLGPPAVIVQFDDLLKVRRIEPGATADVVIVGRDVDFTYERLTIAANAIRAGGCFLALNWDPIMPVDEGVVPGTGSIVAAMEAASGSKATVMGKPELPMMEAGAAILGQSPVLMIGDRIEADIAGARRIGWDAALALTGLTESGAGEPAPDYVLTSLGALARLPQAHPAPR
jgi:HAD superfamily hydrolase (TIGR01450 family)